MMGFFYGTSYKLRRVGQESIPSKRENVIKGTKCIIDDCLA